MALLFAVSTDNVGLHIKNIIAENELDDSTTEESSVVQIEGNRKVTRKIKIYNLDMIISVGYRVKSQRGIIFRRWSNKVLKEYLILIIFYFPFSYIFNIWFTIFIKSNWKPNVICFTRILISQTN